MPRPLLCSGHFWFAFSIADASMTGETMMDSFNEYCSIVINDFAERYANYYKPEFVQEVKSIVSAKAKLSYIDKKAKDLNYPLYLIVLQFRGAELLRCDQL
jgi:hypothetical protein